MTEYKPGDANLPIEAARESMEVRRAFGQAYEVGGTTVIPVAKLLGGSGMGFGAGSGGEVDDDRGGPRAEGSGGGGGFGTRVKPLGVYEVRDGQVTWKPAIDLNRAIIGGQILLAVAVWAFARTRRARHHSRRWSRA